MGRFIKGAVVVLPFPFSDLSATKRRPVLVVADLPGDDMIVCAISSQARTDPYAVPITVGDFVIGGLRHNSNVRTNILFTANSNIALYQTGTLHSDKVNEVVARIIQTLST